MRGRGRHKTMGSDPASPLSEREAETRLDRSHRGQRAAAPLRAQVSAAGRHWPCSAQGVPRRGRARCGPGVASPPSGCERGTGSCCGDGSSFGPVGLLRHWLQAGGPPPRRREESRRPIVPHAGARRPCRRVKATPPRVRALLEHEVRPTALAPGQNSDAAVAAAAPPSRPAAASGGLDQGGLLRAGLAPAGCGLARGRGGGQARACSEPWNFRIDPLDLGQRTPSQAGARRRSPSSPSPPVLVPPPMPPLGGTHAGGRVRRA